MSDPEKLGGFKILKEAVLFSPPPFEADKRLPVALFRILAEHEINLTYITCILEAKGRWRVNMAVDFKNARKAGGLLLKSTGISRIPQSNKAILSIFPPPKKSPPSSAPFLRPSAVRASIRKPWPIHLPPSPRSWKNIY